MKKIYILPVLLLSSFLFLNACSFSFDTETDGVSVKVTDSKDSFVSEEGGFSVNFPGEPTFQSEPVDTAAGQITMNGYVYEESASRVFMVNYSDFPESLIADDPRAMLQDEKGGALETLGEYTLDEEVELTLNGNPGLYYKARAGEYYSMTNTYLVKNRLYQLIILSTGDYPSGEAADSFFGSFKFLK